MDTSFQQKTYLPKPAWLWRTSSIFFLLVAIFLGALSFLFIIHSVFFDQDFTIPYIMVLFVSFATTTTSLTMYFILRLQITLTPNGIEYSGGYYTLYTPWTNVDTISMVARHIHFLVLKQPAEIDVPITEGHQREVAVIERARMTFWMGPSYWLFKRTSHFIPLPSIIVAPREWKTGIFRSYLDIYAPEVSKKIDQMIS